MEALGLTKEKLLAEDYEVLSQISNHLALDLYNLYSKEKHSLAELIKWIAGLSGVQKEKINGAAVLSQLHRLSKAASKKRGIYKANFLSEDFIIAVYTEYKPTGSGAKSPSPECVFKQVSQDLAEELHNTKKRQSEQAKKSAKQNEILRATLKEKTKKISSIYEKNKQEKRKKERLASKVQHLKRKCDMIMEESETVKKPCIKLQKMINTERTLVQKLKSQNILLKTKFRSINSQNKKLVTINKKLTQELSELQKKIQHVNSENVELINDLKEKEKALKERDISIGYLANLLEDNTEIVLFDEESKCFTPECMSCIMNLDQYNIANHHIGSVIKEVLKVAGITPNRIPSRQTVDNIVASKCVVSQKHLSSVLADKTETTLYTDETRKFGHTYNAFIVTDEEKRPYLLGLREMANKSAKTTLDTLKEIIQDISESVGTESQSGQKILCNIKNTMSDRAQTEKAFNNLLEDYRKEILPHIITNWADLNQDQKSNLSRLNNFFCGLHLLVGMADTSAEALQTFEQSYCDAEGQKLGIEKDDFSFLKSNESSTVRLIRTASKCFASGGDEKSGCFQYFRTYCTEKNRLLGFVRFRGNRFNIVFYLAEIVFFHHESIVDFFENYHEPSNMLHKSVLSDIKEPLLIAGCKVLGLLSKLISAPLWRILEGDIHILDMNKWYKKLLDYLERMSQNPDLFLQGKDSPFLAFIHKDEMFNFLVKGSNEIDSLACAIIKILFPALKAMLSRLVVDQLPEGRYDLESENLSNIKSQSKSVIPHNKLPEFAFGVLDFQLRYRPNASLLVNESFLMFTMNKTKEWLETLEEGERNRLLQASRKEGREFREKFRERCKQISEKRRNELRKKEEDIAQKKQKVLAQKEELTNKIIHYGLWQSLEQIERELDSLQSEKEKRDALSSQLKFRKFVLEQQYKDKKVFNLTEVFENKRRPMTIYKLKENLGKLVESSNLSGPTMEREQHGIPLLCGKNVDHTFENGVYQGKVISVVPGYSEWYNIVYKEDPAVYTFKLLDDYRAGNLRLVVSNIDQAGFSEFLVPIYSS